MPTRFMLLFWTLFILSTLRVVITSPLNLSNTHNVRNKNGSKNTSNNKNVSLRLYLESNDSSKYLNNQVSRKDFLANREDEYKVNKDFKKGNLHSQTELAIRNQNYAFYDNLNNITRRKARSLHVTEDTNTYVRAIHNGKANEGTRNTTDNTAHNNKLALINVIKNTEDKFSIVSSKEKKVNLSKIGGQESDASISSDTELPLVRHLDTNNSSRIHKDVKILSDGGEVTERFLNVKVELSKATGQKSDGRIMPEIRIVSSSETINSSQIYNDIENNSYDDVDNVSSFDRKEALRKPSSKDSDARILTDIDIPLVSPLETTNSSEIYKHLENESTLDRKEALRKPSSKDSDACILTDIELPLVNPLNTTKFYKIYNDIENMSYNDVYNVSSLEQKGALTKPSSKDSDARILTDIEVPLVNPLDTTNSFEIYKDIENTSYNEVDSVSSLDQREALTKPSSKDNDARILTNIEFPLVSSLESNIVTRKYSDLQYQADNVCSLHENEELSDNIHEHISDTQRRSDAERSLINSFGLKKVSKNVTDNEYTLYSDVVILNSIEDKENYELERTVGEHRDIPFPFEVKFTPKIHLVKKRGDPRKYRGTPNTSGDSVDIGSYLNPYAKLNSTSTGTDLAVFSDFGEKKITRKHWNIQNITNAEFDIKKDNEELKNSSSVDINIQLPFDLAMKITSDEPSRVDRDAYPYEYIPGLGYYKLHDQAKSWNDARRTCLAEEAHLVVIGSLEEAKVISRIQEDTVVFVGVHDKFVTGQYVTLFDEFLEKSGYVAWGPGQPNDVTERCLAFDSDLTYHDYGCGDLLYYVCERPLSVKGQSTPEHLADLLEETPRGIMIGDYMLFRGIGFYKLHVEMKDWRSAWATCQGEGGHLAVISSQKEADAIKTLFFFKTTPFMDAFVGAHNLFGHEEFTTIFDSPVTMNLHNADSSAPSSCCLTIHRDGRYHQSTWPCNSSLPFVCQIPIK